MGLYILFFITVAGLIILDLNIAGKKSGGVISIKEAVGWSVMWISAALAFNLVILYFMGKEAALMFLAGYVIEKSLSVDNIFVFIMIFSHFGIPQQYQSRALKWGIIGAVVMRAVFIFMGIELLGLFSWTIYIFGGILIITGIKMALKKDEVIDLEQNLILRLARKIVRVESKLHGEKFFIKKNNIVYFTPLMLTLLVIESSDILFAVDSIPAILAITTDPFIVYTSNIFAILGLRALFFFLAGIVNLFKFLKEGISIILVFVGIKMLVSRHYHIETSVSLYVILGILVTAILLSIADDNRIKKAGL